MRQILFLPLRIFDSYVSLIQNKIFFGTLRRISDLTDLAVTSWDFICLLNPGLYGSVWMIMWKLLDFKAESRKEK